MKKYVMLSEIKEMNYFITLEEPIVFERFKAIGYFPYETAKLNGDGCVAVPRSVFSEIENTLRIFMDNKIVVVFEDTERWGTENFAIQFFDSFCKMGALNQIVGYAGKELLSNK